jgi:hypothetical protein
LTKKGLYSTFLPDDGNSKSYSTVFIFGKAIIFSFSNHYFILLLL